MNTLMVRSLLLILALSLPGTALVAQGPQVDPTARLRELLPAEASDRVLAAIERARSRQLPPQAVAALENRAMKYAARGIPAADIEQALGAHADRMQQARTALESARGAGALGEEIDAGAEAMRQGVDGEALSALAKAAPSGRSLAVPIFVLGSLVERGLPSDAALERVRERLTARASDRDLERMAGGEGRGRPEGVGPGMRPVDRPGGVGRPEGVPGNGGRPTLPVIPAPNRPGPGQPTIPPTTPPTQPPTTPIAPTPIPPTP